MSQESTTQRKLTDHLFALLLAIFIGIGAGIAVGLYEHSLSLPAGVAALVVAFFVLRRLICKKTP